MFYRLVFELVDAGSNINKRWRRLIKLMIWILIVFGFPKLFCILYQQTSLNNFAIILFFDKLSQLAFSFLDKITCVIKSHYYLIISEQISYLFIFLNVFFPFFFFKNFLFAKIIYFHIYFLLKNFILGSGECRSSVLA